MAILQSRILSLWTVIKGRNMIKTSSRIFLAFVFLNLLAACAGQQPTPDVAQIANEIETSVALTLTAQPSPIPPTFTPLPTATQIVSPTAVPIPTIVNPQILPTSQPSYVCDIISQQPADDTTFRHRESFDVRWTIVNKGTQKWENGARLEYQTGPEMTTILKVDIPKLKPGETFEVILDAKSPEELERQIMVWAVLIPGVDGAIHWACYPYVRIIVQ
ncbi:MAG: hypothetical protein HZB50_04345 [Chloroflexi bacterium]|nr:hypothetical protein [Chloroflexota bacterium]